MMGAEDTYDDRIAAALRTATLVTGRQTVVRLGPQAPMSRALCPLGRRAGQEDFHAHLG